MRKFLPLILVACLLLCLYGCNSTNAKYDKLIAAIEADDYTQALAELQALMNIPATPEGDSDTPDEDGTGCSHHGPDATCTRASTCEKCGAELAAALGHDYQDGACVRCGEADPTDAAMLKAYQAVISNIQYFEQYGGLNVHGVGMLRGSSAVEYLYQELSALGNYRDCGDYLSRISIVPDKLLYISLKETDNFGSVRSSTTIDYEYDAQGRVIMSEDISFNEQFGIYLLDYFSKLLHDHYASGDSQYLTKLTYGEDDRITEIQCYYVSLRAIITPAYNAEGRIESASFRLNTESGTLSFTYNDMGQLTEITNGDFAKLTCQYSADGRLISKDNKIYTYDDQGRLTGWTAGSASCTVQTDDQGRIAQEQVVDTEGKTVYDYHYGNYYVYQPSNTD